ncbi:MAG: 50S ribosomal protein L6 [Phycisphaerales bacterium]|nr:MAG: 50S ribosomal protein L6 [Phycisphaerales bacterium]
MSRIGKQPVAVPAAVKVTIQNGVVAVESGGKKLEMKHRPEVRVDWDESEKAVRVTIDEKHAGNREVRAYWGMTRSIIQNMVQGVSKGFEKTLEINGVGWGAVNAGKTLDLKLGYANIIKVPIPMGVDVNVDRNFVKISGPDKQAVGQFAAVVRSKRKPEPYNGKGIKYSDEVIRRKQGKAFGS